MKWLLKLFKWLLGGVVVVLVFGYLLLLVVNWSDRPVNDSVRQLAELLNSRPPVADGENGYVYLMGMDALADVDPQRAGEQRIVQLQKAYAKSQHKSFSEPPYPHLESLSYPRSEITELFDRCVTPDKTCYEQLIAHQAAIDGWLKSNALLSQRYLLLLERPKWKETLPTDITMPIPRYNVVLEGQRILLMQVWILAGRGDSKGVHKLLQRDIRFWRTILSSSSLMITKMVAQAAMARHFSWATLALKRFPAKQLLLAVPEEWHQPLSPQELSIHLALAGEWHFFDTMLQRTKKDVTEANTSYFFDEDVVSWPEQIVDRAAQPFFQTQDASNRYADYLSTIAKLSDVSSEQFPQAFTRLRKFDNDYAESNDTLLHLYNPIGRILAGIAVPFYSDYTARVHDLEGVRRLALLSVQLHGAAATQDKIEQSVATSKITNPYTGKPFALDKVSHALLFDGMARGKRGHYAFYY